MKIWIKLLVGMLLGAAVAWVTPAEAPALDLFLSKVLGVAFSFARFLVAPLFLVSAIVAVHESREQKLLGRVARGVALVSVAGVVIAGALGVAVAVLAGPGRIPLVSGGSVPGLAPTMHDVVRSMVPSNALGALSPFETGFMPLLAVALAIGLALGFDRAATRPLTTLLDSGSRVLWQVNSFVAEVLPVFVIAVAAARFRELRTILAGGLYTRLILVATVETLFVALVLIPGALWLFGGRKNPYRVLYGLLAPSMAAFVSGELPFAAGTLAKHLKDSLGVRRRAGAAALPLAFALGRAGTAMMVATSFVVVLDSYSQKGFDLDTVLWMLAAVPAVSLLMGAAPALGPVAALASLSAWYGRGFESGYLLAAPAALPLAALAALLDALWTGAAVHIAARSAGEVAERPIRHFA
ncbi:MAG: dicarboxylate/amino acid:cation symporter [Spirochaetales bacterium]|nr:dicarboxylate/amino acid:cation symporter [Spirochaetales bacterium]